MNLNLNIGILGHVDSGKTSLAKSLSEISSTAAFDKNPQSQQRGITLDLGFSALTISDNIPKHLNYNDQQTYEKIQFTLIDCPGHASLIRTVIGGAQIMDLILLVIDIVKGIQTQTVECLAIGELTCKNVIIVLNKIDLLDKLKKDSVITKFKKKIWTVLAETNFCNSPIVAISVINNENLLELKNVLVQHSFIPARNLNASLLIAIDHCFSMKGQGTICTGTILQGKLNVGDEIEIPKIKNLRKIKSIHSFRKSINLAKAGDRIGLCITQFDPNLLERGMIAKANYLKEINMAIFKINLVKYFKGSISSKSKFHMSIGYETVIGKITLFAIPKSTIVNNAFNFANEYEYLDSIDMCEKSKVVYILVEFEKSVIIAPNALVLGTKLDLDINVNQCRIAFWGHLEIISDTKNYRNDVLSQLKVYKRKTKIGTVQRVINANELICDNLFKKNSIRELFIGMKINLSTNEIGVIESTFGSTTKVRIKFFDVLSTDTMEKLKTPRDINVIFNFKKYIFDKNNKILQ